MTPAPRAVHSDMLTALALTLLSQAPTDLDRCTRDSDCVISTLQCCQGCCGPGPYATTKQHEAATRQKCSVIKCAAPECTIVCEPPASPDGFIAKCEKAACVMKTKARK